LVATEQQRTQVSKQRDDWLKQRWPAISAQPERIDFIDKATIKAKLTRNQACSQRGERLVMDAPFKS